jgi:hypothetical protein
MMKNESVPVSAALQSLFAFHFSSLPAPHVPRKPSGFLHYSGTKASAQEPSPG